MTLLKAFGLATGLVCTKIVALSLYANYKRVVAQKKAEKEKKSSLLLTLDLIRGAPGAEDPEAERAADCLSNAVDTFVPFFALGSLHAHTGGDENVGAMLCYGYAASTCLHAWLYLGQRARGARQLSFIGQYTCLGWLCVGTLARALFGS